MIVSFDDVEIDLAAFEIRRGGEPQPVEPQVMDVVVLLLERHGELVSKEEILDTVWGTRFVGESSLTSRIKAARRALGDDGRAQRVIATVHGRGYRFVAPIERRAERPEPLVASQPGERTLLERDGALATLHEAVRNAAAGHGRVVLVAGEAGIGKTSLVATFSAQLDPRVRQLHGACDDLVTPRALGPFDDISLDVPELAAVLRDPGPGDVERVMLAELSSGDGPVVVIIEDAHWADEATIDVLTHLVRRLERLPATLVLTFRDNEVVGDHPLLRALGRVPAAIARHLRLQPLSVAAIASLVGEDQAAEVAGATGGIPFFVTEVASLGPDDRGALPESVSHAVRARMTALPDETRDLMEQIAVEPSRTAIAVLDRLVPSWPDAIASAERVGIASMTTTSVAFRHELARLAVLEGLPSSRRRTLHQRMTDVLVDSDAGADRIVHHADGAGDLDRVVEYAVAAAERARGLSAHRQAWAHYARVLPLLDRFSARRAAEIQEAASSEAYHVDLPDEALRVARRALAAFEALDDRASTGRLHRWLSRLHWSTGQREGAEREAALAVEVLEPLGPSEELAWALSTRSQLAMLAWDAEETVRHGTSALELAESLGAEAVQGHALINLAIGASRADGIDTELLERGIEISARSGAHHEVVRGLLGGAYGPMESDQLDIASEYAQRALRHGIEYEIDTLRAYVEAILARIDFLRGRWSAAEARLLAQDATASATVNRMVVLRTLGQLAVRRGDGDATALIAEQRALVDASGELQRVLPVLEIEAESAWLHGGLDGLVPRLRAALPDAVRFPAHAGRIARWLQEAGALVDVPDGVPEPHRAEIEGRWADAASRWRELGMPYEAANAGLRCGGAERDRALVLADELGAAPLIARLATR